MTMRSQKKRVRNATSSNVTVMPKACRKLHALIQSSAVRIHRPSRESKGSHLLAASPCGQHHHDTTEYLSWHRSLGGLWSAVRADDAHPTSGDWREEVHEGMMALPIAVGVPPGRDVCWRPGSHPILDRRVSGRASRRLPTGMCPGFRRCLDLRRTCPVDRARLLTLFGGEVTAPGKLLLEVGTDFRWLEIEEGAAGFEVLDEDFPEGVRRSSGEHRHRHAAND